MKYVTATIIYCLIIIIILFIDMNKLKCFLDKSLDRPAVSLKKPVKTYHQALKDVIQKHKEELKKLAYK